MRTPSGSPCAGTSIAGETLNNQLPQSQRICAAPGLDCCVRTFPAEQLAPLRGTTLETPIVKRPRCGVMDTDGARVPYSALATKGGAHASAVSQNGSTLMPPAPRGVLQ